MDLVCPPEMKVDECNGYFSKNADGLFANYVNDSLQVIDFLEQSQPQ